MGDGRFAFCLIFPAVLLQAGAASAQNSQPVEVKRLGLPANEEPPKEEPAPASPQPGPTPLEPRKRIAKPTPMAAPVEPVILIEPEPDHLVEAWSAYEAKSYSAAAAAFERALNRAPVEAAYGAALSYNALGQYADAAAYAQRSIREGQTRQQNIAPQQQIFAFIRLSQASGAKEEGDFEAALEFANEAAQFDQTQSDAVALMDGIYFELAENASGDGDYTGAVNHLGKLSPETLAQPEIRRLTAWTSFRAENYSDAFEQFSALYADTKADEDADGLYYSAQQLGFRSRLESEVGPDDTRLAALLNRDRGENAFYEKDFFKAYRLGAPQAERLTDIDKSWIGVRTGPRFIDGSSGEGQLALTSFEINAGLQATARGQFDMTLRGISARNGLGSDDFDALIPRVSWRREDTVDYAIEVSTTPVGAPGLVLPLAEAGIRRTEGRNQTSATLYARSREESLLSLGGREDPLSGNVYGRVVAMGGEVEARRSVSANWSLSGALGGEYLTGANVIDNTRWRGELRASRLFLQDQTDYFSIGPFVRLESYDTNTNFYAYGHGGYFSPDLFAQSGLGLNFRSPELQSYIVQVDAELAGEYVREADGFEFPLTSSGTLFEGGTNSQASGSLRVKYLQLLDEHWFIGAEAGLTQSSQFQDAGFAFTLRRTFGERRALTSRDLEPPSSRAGLWP